MCSTTGEFVAGRRCPGSSVAREPGAYRAAYDDRIELSERSRLPADSARCSNRWSARCTSRRSATPDYVALGFAPSPGDANGVALPDGPSYFASRGSVMGQVPGEVIAAAFGVFNPAIVVPLVDEAWQRTDAATIRDARAEGAVGQLRRLLGDAPDGLDRAAELLATGAAAPLPIAGRPLAAGIRSLDRPHRPARRGVAPRRLPARVPRRFPQRGVGLGGPQRHRDRPADGDVLGPAACAPTAGLAAGPSRSSTPPRPALRDRGLLDGDGFSDAGREAAGSDRGRHRRPDGTGPRRARRRRVRTVRDPGAVGCRGARRSRLPAVDGPHDLAKR